MTAQRIDCTALELPQGVELWQHAPDFLVLAGPGLTRERYHDIKATLPAELQERLAGWRKLEGRRR